MLNKKEIFSAEVVNLLENWEKCYPTNQKRSVIIPGLHVLQDHNNGYLTEELMDKLAAYLDVEVTFVYEVATFYSMYDLKKVGRHKLNICTNLSCMLNGAKKIIAHAESKLGIKAGETTPDSKFTLRSVECQGACCGAPMLEVNKIFYENLTIEKVDQIIDSLE